MLPDKAFVCSIKGNEDLRKHTFGEFYVHCSLSPFAWVAWGQLARDACEEKHATQYRCPWGADGFAFLLDLFP